MAIARAEHSAGDPPSAAAALDHQAIVVGQPQSHGAVETGGHPSDGVKQRRVAVARPPARQPFGSRGLQDEERLNVHKERRAFRSPGSVVRELENVRRQVIRLLVEATDRRGLDIPREEEDRPRRDLGARAR